MGGFSSSPKATNKPWTMTKEEWEIHQAMPIDYSKDHHDIAAQINKHNEGAEYHQYELELQQQEEENVRN